MVLQWNLIHGRPVMEYYSGTLAWSGWGGAFSAIAGGDGLVTIGKLTVIDVVT